MSNRHGIYCSENLFSERENSLHIKGDEEIEFNYYLKVLDFYSTFIVECISFLV